MTDKLVEGEQCEDIKKMDTAELVVRLNRLKRAAELLRSMPELAVHGFSHKVDTDTVNLQIAMLTEELKRRRKARLPIEFEVVPPCVVDRTFTHVARLKVLLLLNVDGELVWRDTVIEIFHPMKDSKETLWLQLLQEKLIQEALLELIASGVWYCEDEDRYYNVLGVSLGKSPPLFIDDLLSKWG